MVYDDDLEMSRRAADHEFLKKLSAAGGGEFFLAKDLGPLLAAISAAAARAETLAITDLAELAHDEGIALFRRVFRGIRGAVGGRMVAAPAVGVWL